MSTVKPAFDTAIRGREYKKRWFPYPGAPAVPGIGKTQPRKPVLLAESLLRRSTDVHIDLA